MQAEAETPVFDSQGNRLVTDLKAYNLDQAKQISQPEPQQTTTQPPTQQPATQQPATQQPTTQQAKKPRGRRQRQRAAKPITQQQLPAQQPTQPIQEPAQQPVQQLVQPPAQSTQQPQRQRRGRNGRNNKTQQPPSQQQPQQTQAPQTQQDQEPNKIPALPQESKQEARGDHAEEVPSKAQSTAAPVRTVDQENQFFYEIDDTSFGIKQGFVPHMNVDGRVYVNQTLRKLLFEELQHQGAGGFLPAVKQVANVASLPGIIGCSIGLPDIHSGYGFAIGNVAAFDMDNSEAVVSPGGVGFDINCGVRLIRTNLTEQDVTPFKEQIAEALYRAIPVGVGSGGSVKCQVDQLDQILDNGLDWAIAHGIAWPEDKEFCEERGKMQGANSAKVSARAKARGIHEIGSLGAGNHYTEVQVVDEIYDEQAAKALGLERVGQVCVMVHCGSRGLGHQVATDFLQTFDKTLYQQHIQLNDKQLACSRINSQEGQDYLAAMACACNFAWVNRQGITHQIRQAFSHLFKKSAQDLDMKLIYDVSHNVAKKEQHMVDGQQKNLLVHRKGATRSFPPNHPSLPDAYKQVGQPVFIGGTMGTASYVLLGTEEGMKKSFGSTCHGAGRQLSRHKSRNALNANEVMANLKSQGISIRIQTPKLVMEEAPETYKDVHQVIDTCARAGLSKKCAKLRPIAVIKG